MILSRLVAGAPLVIMCLLACAHARGADFRSIGAPSVVLYDAPSAKGGKRYIAPRGMPVEIVARYGAWVKVRDADGELAWTESSGLSARRNVVVKALSAKLRAAPDDNAAILMTADKGVLLELVDPQATDWVSVRHQDGFAGFVRANEIWGI